MKPRSLFLFACFICGIHSRDHLISRASFQLIAPEDGLYQCGNVPASLGSARYSGNCNGEPLKNLTITESRINGSCPGTYTLTRNFTGIDQCNMVSSDSQVVRVVDTLPPAINSSSTTYECGSMPPVAAVVDACDSSPTLSYVDAPIPVDTCVGYGVLRTYTTTDDCGNSVTQTVTYEAVDMIAPQLSTPSNITVGCDSITAPIITGRATANDSCSAVTTTYSDEVLGDGDCPYIIIRTFTARDTCGNTATGVQYITVSDAPPTPTSSSTISTVPTVTSAPTTTPTSTIATPVTSTATAGKCGNGVVEGGEECDGGVCCTAQCLYAPRGAPCGASIGLCDVPIPSTCSGTASTCPSSPPKFPGKGHSWRDFHVISFDAFTQHGGSVQGRIAVKNRVSLQGFSLGSALTLLEDGYRRWTLFVARLAQMTDGSILPDGSRPSQGAAAYAYVGETVRAPTYLQQRVDPEPALAAEDAAQGFTDLQQYYVQVQRTLREMPINAVASLQYGNGLLITCSQPSQQYHVLIPASVLSAAQWTELRGCTFGAHYILDIIGEGDVLLQGQPFPGITERVVYSISGNRTVRGSTGVAGHILAPSATWEMYSGATQGTLIAGNVTFSRQNNKPNCARFSATTVSTRTTAAVSAGEVTVGILDSAALLPGDVVCMGEDCQSVLSIEHMETGATVTLLSALTGDHAQGSLLTALISDPSSRLAPSPSSAVTHSLVQSLTQSLSHEQLVDSGASSCTGLVALLGAILALL